MTEICTSRHIAAVPPPGILCHGEGGIPLQEALRRVNLPLFVLDTGSGIEARIGDPTGVGEYSLPLLGFAPRMPLDSLGDALFLSEHGIRFPYVAGSMAKGISSATLVEEMAREGMIGFFGAAGLPLATVEQTIHRLKANLGDLPFGINLIHSPHEPDLEKSLADLFLRQQVRLIEASAFLDLSLPLVKYRVSGIHRGSDGRVLTPNRIIAKISREEIAAKFFSPPPEKYLRELVASGCISAEQAELAACIPMADDVTAEADSGGHTDNRPAVALLPTICSLRDRLQEKHGYARRLLVGLGGGIGTPHAAAAAFAMGAAYIVTGSVHQACIESGTCDAVRDMLAKTRQADVVMAPAADMFEMGVTVQVLKRGTMFAMRAAKLYELYRSWGSIEEIPPVEREKLEKTVFQAGLDTVWQQTRSYFLKRDPRQVERAEREPKHLMALVFRWYLGQAAHWAKDGDAARQMDYQVWCGPSMGAFNEWVDGTFLAEIGNRKASTVALNLLHGAAVCQRINALRCQRVPLSSKEMRVTPLDPVQIKEYLK